MAALPVEAGALTDPVPGERAGLGDAGGHVGNDGLRNDSLVGRRARHSPYFASHYEGWKRQFTAITVSPVLLTAARWLTRDIADHDAIDTTNRPSPDYPRKADWRAAWVGMPEFDHRDLMPWKSMLVHFPNPAALADFAQVLGQPLTEHTRYVHFPRVEPEKVAHLRYVSAAPRNPVYPVYVISKGRAKSRLTVKALEAIGVPYHVVVEPQELERYAEHIPREKILVLPFSNLGQGSIPARNWVWEHALAVGARRHWIMDDNIKNFWRFNRNQKIRVGDGTILRAMEEFADRYENVALCGPNYYMFAPRKCGSLGAFTANTRVYSCILIDNALPYRWRGRYNEDTDLSLRALKDGYATVLFNAFLAEKMPTMKMKGGNTDELYQGDGRLAMAQSLQEQHPDVTKITRKWERWQHHVDYRPFAGNVLRPRPGAEASSSADEFGMSVVEVEGRG